MDESDTDGNRTFNLQTLLRQVVESGFNQERYNLFEGIFNRPPSYQEMVTPALLLVNSREGSVPVELYRQLGQNMQTDNEFYFKRCPLPLMIQSGRSLEKSINESITYTGKEIKYLPGVNISTTSPAKYQRLEESKKPELPVEDDCHQRMYVTTIDISGLDLETATELFEQFYQRLPKTKLEVHNNKDGIHKEVTDLEEAVGYVRDLSYVAKIDQPLESKEKPKVNVYLKPNSSYHIRVDVLGTKKEITQFAQNVEKIISQVLTN